MADGVNTTDILALADHLDRVHRAEQYFNMRQFFLDYSDIDKNGDYECQSPSCMAGHYLAMKGVHVFRRGQRIEYVAAQKLNIPYEDANALFLPGGDERYAANAKQCAWLLRKYVSTGVIDWKGALEQ